jgi:hypothetical protein
MSLPALDQQSRSSNAITDGSDGRQGSLIASLSSGLLSLMAGSEQPRAPRWLSDQPEFSRSEAGLEPWTGIGTNGRAG